MIRENFLVAAVKKTQESVDSSDYSPLKKMILGSNYGNIGKYVVANMQLSQHLGNTAVSICRRRFKTSDLVLIDVLDEEEEGEAGIAFTEKGIYCWEEDESFVAEIRYDNIAEVDYDDENVIVTTVEGKNIELFCGEDENDEKYSRYMYNFIMDIKEAYEEIKQNEIVQ